MATFLKSRVGLPLCAKPSREAEDRRHSFIQKARAIAESIHAMYPRAEVVGFGSTFTGFCFDKDSDIDIAIKGIPLAMHAHIWNMAADVAGTEDVDIVMVEEADPRLLASIKRDGVPL